MISSDQCSSSPKQFATTVVLQNSDNFRNSPVIQNYSQTLLRIDKQNFDSSSINKFDILKNMEEENINNEFRKDSITLPLLMIPTL